MPYIKVEARERIMPLLEPLLDYSVPYTEGELNYIITRLLLGRPIAGGYAGLNAAIGVLECVKLELYRRKAAPYEDRKISENGDVY